MPWEWKSMAVEICIGEAINFGENELLLVGQENTLKCLPIPFSIHVLHFPQATGSFPHDFPVFSSFFHTQKSIFVLLSGWEERFPDFWV